MNTLFKYFVFFALFILAATSTLAQNWYPCSRTLSTENGIPSPETYYAMQASDGKMWFGTDNGAFSYDGYDIKTYSKKDGLGNTVVFQISEDENHNIWFNTMQGNVYIYSPSKDTITPYRYNNKLQEAIQPLRFAQFIQYDSETKTLYSVTNVKGLYRVDSLGNIVHFNTLSKDIMAEFYKDKNLKLDTFRMQNSVDYIAKISGDFQVKPFFYLKPKFPYFQALPINDKDVLLLKKKDKVSTLYFFKNHQHQWTKELPFTPGILNLKDSNIYFPTIFNDFGLYNASIDELEKSILHPLSPKMPSSYITFDKNNGFWLCTLTDGIHYFPNENISLFSHSKLPYHLDLRSIYKTKQQIFLSDIQNHVYSVNLKDYSVKVYPKVPKSGNNPNNLFFDEKNNKLWYGNFVFDKNKWRKIKGLTKNQNIIGYSKSRMSQDSNFLYLTIKNSFAKIDLRQQTIQYLPNNSDDNKYRSVCVYEDFDNNIWIGNTDGLFRWADNQLIKATNNSLLNTRIEDIKQLKDSTLVLATKGEGVILYKNKIIKQFTKNDGLTSDLVENIAIDSLENIWVGTMNGLNIIKKIGDNFQIQKTTFHNGLPTNEIYQIIPGNPAWIASSKGLVRLYSSPDKSEIVPPTIKAFLVNDKQQTDVELKYDQNNIGIQFSSMDYRLSDQLLYRYRLNPTSNHWNTTHDRKIYFLGLSPDDYTFEVQSQNDQNIWSPSAFQSFTIQKPYWQSWLFRILLFIFFNGIGLWFYLKQKKENTLNQKINLLEKQALQAQINPHFIFNVLNAIQSSILQNNMETASRNLTSFAKLIRSTLHFVSSPYIYLEEEIESLKNYLSIEQMRFENGFTFAITIDEKVNLYQIQLPPMIIQPFVENAVLHGINNERKKGKICIDFGMDDQYLIVKITDNGKGISNSLHSEHDSSHQSVGMSITKRRLELINGEKNKVFIQVADQKNDEGQITGTLVILKILVKKIEQ